MLLGLPLAVPAYVLGRDDTRRVALASLLGHLWLAAVLAALRAMVIAAGLGHSGAVELASSSWLWVPYPHALEAAALLGWVAIAVPSLVRPAALLRAPLVGGASRTLERGLRGMLRLAGFDPGAAVSMPPPPGTLPSPDGPVAAPAVPGFTVRTGMLVGLLALGLRLPLLSWGLPLGEHRHHIHPDEKGVLGHARTWPLTPVLNVYPQYPALIGGLVASGTPVGAGLLAAIKLHAPQHEKLVTLVFGRLLSMVIAALGAVALGSAAAMITRNHRAGLVAGVAAAAAVWPAHASAFLTGDAVAAAWFAFVIWACAQILIRGERRDYALAGLFVGIGAATKYSAVLGALPVAASWLWQGRQRARASGAERRAWLGDATLSAGTALCVFLLANPVVFLDPGALAGRLAFEAGILDIHASMPLARYAGHVASTWATVLGWPLFALCAATAPGWLRERRVLMLALPPLALFLIGARGFYGRHLIALAPLVLLLGTAGAVRLAAVSPLVGRAVGVVLAGGVVLCGLTVWQRAGEVRASARVTDELTGRIEPGSRVYVMVVPEYCPKIRTEGVSFERGLADRASWTGPRYLLLQDDMVGLDASLLRHLDPIDGRLPPAESWRVFHGVTRAPEYFRVLRELLEDPGRPGRAPYRVVSRHEQPLAFLPLGELEFFPLGFTLYERRDR